MSDQPSRLKAALAGRYTIERELGAGGMATVYLAQDVKHGRHVAVKVLRPELAETIGPDRFVREIEIAAALHHPHILPLYDSGEAAGFLFYVMPYVEGESLRDRLAREGELPVADAVRILREMADALAKAHAQGVVHRDIKPDNVLLADRHAAVADFGVAKAVSEATGRHGITTAGVALGTPTYMAPEQASADPHVDHRADIYAFGVVAYEMLTGEPPFTGASSQQVLAAHVTEAPRAVTSRRAAVPEPLAELVMRCLEKKPADRWQSAEEIGDRLEVIATPSGGTTPTTAQPATRTGRRPGSLVVGLAGALVVIVAAVAFFLRRGGGAVETDPMLVAVLPFRVSGAGEDLANLREGMVDLMATYLTGEGETVRSADPGTVFGAWRAQVSNEEADLSTEAAADLARSLGAGRVLTGSVIGSEAQLILRGTMSSIDVVGEPVQAHVEGPVDSLLSLLPRFAGQLLAQSTGEGGARAAALTTTSLPALRAFLQGQSEYRRGRFVQAVRRYSEALEADSNFALAGFGLVSANGWTGSASPNAVRIAVQAAWEHRDVLGAKDRALVVAALGPNGPGPDDGMGLLQARERAVAVAPDRAEAWYNLGDLYMHDGALLGVEDGLDRAAEAFRRAIGRDSLRAGPLQHLILLAAGRGDTAGVRRWTSLYDRAVRDPLVSINEDWFAGVVLGDTARRDAALALIDTGAVDVGELGTIAFAVPFLGSHADEVLEYLSHVGHRAVGQQIRDRGALLEAFAALDLGRPQAARTAFERVGREHDGILAHATLFWGADSAAGARAAARLSDRPDVASGAFEIRGSDLCVATLWRQLSGDGGGTAAAASRLRATADGRDPSWPETLNQLCADALDALAAQSAGRPESAELIDRLDRTLATRPSRAVSWLNLLAARLLEGEGEFARAAAAARRHVYYFGYTPFYSTHLREMGRLSELAGDREGAIEAYSRYLDLRQEPEPSVQPEVEAVRQALARLVGETR